MSTGSYELRVTHRALIAGPSWLRVSGCSAPKVRSVGPEARGPRLPGCAWRTWPGSTQKWWSQQRQGLGADSPEVTKRVQSGTKRCLLLREPGSEG